MDEQLTISTPEQVAFNYEMAGIGTRFVASLFDHLILGAVIVLVYCATAALIPTLGAGAIMSGDESGLSGIYFVMALLVLIEFVILWGYFVLFELVWNGQTPGKRAAKPRVIRRDGPPVRAGGVMARNLVRFIDCLPALHATVLLGLL